MSFLPDDPSGPYVVNGLPLGGDGRPGIRKELRDFINDDADMWNLYLLGLWQFQEMPMKKQLSYFQVAGIHGLPYTAWPQGDKNLEDIKAQEYGFCTHTSILFLTWHRPYLALFESILQKAMQHVAEQFTKEEGQARYLAAADAFRMPFWDWARPGLPVFPDEATDSKLARVVMPESLRVASKLDKVDGGVDIPNPLFAYRFQKGTGTDFIIDTLTTTTRYHPAGTKTEETPEEQKKFLVEYLTPYFPDVNKQLTPEQNLRERSVYLLKSYDNFAQVSHNKWDQDQVEQPRTEDGEAPSTTEGHGFGSIEDIHNTVHVMVGGQGQDARGNDRIGHMGRVPISAFDPIFWLHHTNIDRLVSIWQGLHDDKTPDGWVTTRKAARGTWVTGRGQDEGIKTPLAPFYKDEKDFWNSDEVRDTAKFGYAYPETKSWNFATVDDYRKDIRKKLDDLYPTGSFATMVANTRAGDSVPEETLRKRAKRLARIGAAEGPNTTLTALSLAQTISPASFAESKLGDLLPPVSVPNIQVPDGRSIENMTKDNKYLEWLFNIKAVKHCLDGQYLVHVFLGDVPPEESTVLYSVSPFHVGTFSPLGQSQATKCGKCQVDQAERIEVTGQIPLTIALAERYFAGLLPSFSEADVVKYLRKNLHWEVVDNEGQRRARQRDIVDGLLVGVVSNEVKLPDAEHEFPQYSANIKVYPEITTNRDGNGRGEGTGITEGNKYFYEA